ncbi:low choriolytic enzyme-like [Cololabis saira]|uniref:low choriolytic enzyme-like n=1 Tax=Cololabis saira TaxID=129043 RepID=UPI002AD33755|nr:low choriolytic enzyme-like [Cololabis saira]
MTPAFLFLLFLSLIDFSPLQSAPTDLGDRTEKSTNVFEIIPTPRAGSKTPLLLGDIAVVDPVLKNADPCTGRGCKWPKSGRYVYVPYYIDNTYSDKERSIILRGLKSFHESTCIRFIPWAEGRRDYIHFFTRPQSGCWSSLGRQNGGQYISLERYSCTYHSTVQHEVLHALGFNHEQVRSDRDRYVRILFQNIRPDQRHNFMKKQTNNLGTPYDFASVMHYKNYDFSKNGQPTIVAKDNPRLSFGYARQMSHNDIARLNKLYKCSYDLLSEV